MTWLTNMITQIKNPVLIMITQAPHLKSEKLLAFSDFTFVLYPHTTNVKSEKDIFVSRWESVGTLNTAVKARAERNYHLAWLTIIKKKQVIHPNITNSCFMQLFNFDSSGTGNTTASLVPRRKQPTKIEIHRESLTLSKRELFEFIRVLHMRMSCSLCYVTCYRS